MSVKCSHYQRGVEFYNARRMVRCRACNRVLAGGMSVAPRAREARMAFEAWSRAFERWAVVNEPTNGWYSYDAARAVYDAETDAAYARAVAELR